MTEAVTTYTVERKAGIDYLCVNGIRQRPATPPEIGLWYHREEFLARVRAEYEDMYERATNGNHQEGR